MPSSVDEKELFSDFLKRKGLKTTQERTALFEEVFSSHRHFDVEDLVQRMREKGKKISRATAYRTLEILHECGLVGRVRLNEEKYRYERLHKGEHHDHLICTHCGRVIEFVEPRIERLQDQVCEKHGFLATSHSHQIRGLCSSCQRRQPALASAASRPS
jgi:Fur family transcriptional regulator, ferric uptake regulator